ncbi:hypothetical protein OFB80_29080, partial [Escherichia coli]|nr:hypothetical protein [Escherichia coli]
INAPSREVLELVLKIAANIENHSSTIAAFVCAANDAPEKRVNMSSPEYYSSPEHYAYNVCQQAGVVTGKSSSQRFSVS